jgi:hypothetical protein
MIRAWDWLGKPIFAFLIRRGVWSLLGDGPSYEYMFEVNDGKLNSRFEEVGGSGYGDGRGKGKAFTDGSENSGP